MLQYGVWCRFERPSARGRMPTCAPVACSRRASAFSSPGPAWNDELAAASSSRELVSWKSANSDPTADRRAGDVGDQGAVGAGDPHVEADRDAGEQHGERSLD